MMLHPFYSLFFNYCESNKTKEPILVLWLIIYEFHVDIFWSIESCHMVNPLGC